MSRPLGKLYLKVTSHQILQHEVKALSEKLLRKMLGRLGKVNPYKRSCKVAFYTAHFTELVRRDFVSFSTISVRYVQLVKQKIVYACRVVVCVAVDVYAFRNYLSVFLRKCGVMSHDPSAGLLGTFQLRI